MKQFITLFFILFSIAAMAQTDTMDNSMGRQKTLLRRLAGMSESNRSMVDTATVTDVNSKTGKVTAKVRTKGEMTEFKINTRNLDVIKKGDTIYCYYEDIQGDLSNCKVTYSTKDNQTIISTSTVRRKDRRTNTP